MAQNLPQPPPVADDDADQQGPVTAATLLVARATPSVTHEELTVSQQELFYSSFANLAGPVGLAQAFAPIDAQLNALAIQMNNMAQAMAPILNAQLNDMAQNIARSMVHLHNLNARQMNSTVAFVEDLLEPIQNAAGVVAPNFPATLQAFNNLNSAERQQLLEFYGRPANPIHTREQRLQQVFGIQL